VQEKQLHADYFISNENKPENELIAEISGLIKIKT
jgi:hypothetical protein